MKYEFITLDDDYKSNPKNFYHNDKEESIIDLTSLLAKNNKLKFPIAVFINGLLIRTDYFKFKNKLLTIDEDYYVYDDDRVYMIFTSTNSEENGYIYQYKLVNFTVLEENKSTISIGDPLVIDEINEVIGVMLNGVLYSEEFFEVTESTLTFTKFEPEYIDDISLMMLKR